MPNLHAHNSKPLQMHAACPESAVPEVNEPLVHVQRPGTPQSTAQRCCALPTLSTSALLRLAAWCVELVTAMLVCKLFALVGIPSDASVPQRPHQDAAAPTEFDVWSAWELATGVQELLNYGALLALLCDVVATPVRFAYLYGRERWWWHATLLVSGPAFSAFTDLPLLESDSLTAGAGASELALVAVLGVILLLLAGWHVAHARRYEPPPALAEWLLIAGGLLAYTAAYVGGLLQYTSSVAGAGAAADGAWHLHHWWIAWCLACCCRFSRWPSALPLALCTGIFVQGVAIYGAAPIVTDRECVYFGSAANSYVRAAVPAFRCSANASSGSSSNGITAEVCFYRGAGVCWEG